MTVHTFQAPSAAEAVAQIRRQLGPEAVVLNVRRAPAAGLARLWRRPQIEVQATVPTSAVPEASVPAPAPATDPVLATLRELRREMAGLKRALTPARPEVAAPAAGDTFSPGGAPELAQLAMNFGLLPPLAQAAERAWLASGADGEARTPCAWLEDWLAGQWRTAPSSASSEHGAHVFIGPAGSGKSTVLCKWLAQETLLHGRRAAVWRLDSGQANTAGWLDLYAEILGVPVERRVAASAPEATHLFIDLPGTDWTSAVALRELADRLRGLPAAQIHLVLNGAYEPTVWLAQAAAFAALPVSDVVVTHLDEVPERKKLWNLVLGTNLPLRWLSAGQNVPGVFMAAAPAALGDAVPVEKPQQNQGWQPA